MLRSAVIGCSVAFIVGCGTPQRDAAAPPAPAPVSSSAASAATPPAPGVGSEDPADALHRAAIVVDTHSDVTQRLVLEGADLTERLEGGQLDVPRMREGGLDAEFLSVWAPPMLFPGERAYAYALEQIDAIERVVSQSPDLLALATTAEQVRHGVAAGKTVLLMGLEGGHMLGDAPDDELVERLKKLGQRGVRYMTLTWSNSNRIGGSSGDDGASRGLSPFGRRVVETMNEVGIVVDVSHVSDATFSDVMKVAKRPVLASHSSARALSPHPRNMTDEMLRAVADNGGAVCVNFGPQFLDAEWSAQHQKLQGETLKKLRASMGGPPTDPKAVMREAAKAFDAIGEQLPDVPASRVVDHIEHIAQVAGVAHVCLGSDFDGIPKAPKGLDDASKMGFITRALHHRGFSEQDIRQILGKNVLRVLTDNGD
jgi:membrane dipeptidase